MIGSPRKLRAICPGRRAGANQRTQQAGFALVSSLMLMTMLLILAMGLLSLSSISIRSSGRAADLAQARSNARLALHLAISQLQEKAGPDRRITAPASLLGDDISPQVTGVWESWRPSPDGGNSYDAEKRTRHLGNLISASSAHTGSTRLMLGKGTLGPEAGPQDQVSAPLIPLDAADGGGIGGAIAWLALDEGVKARLDLAPADPAETLPDLVSRIGSPARNRFDSLEGLAFLSSSEAAARLPILESLDTAELMLAESGRSRPLTRDFSVVSASLQTNAADGGLKTDLSALFDDALPASHAGRYLYSDSKERITGGAGEPLWDLYAGYARLYRDHDPDKGITAALPDGFRFETVNNRLVRSATREPDMSSVRSPVLMPTLIRVEMIFSLVVRDTHSNWRSLNAKGFPYLLHMMYLPIITLHNPYNVPLRFTELEVAFGDVPMGFDFEINGRRISAGGLKPLQSLYMNNSSGKKDFKLTLTGSLERASEVVMGPGETRIFGKPFKPGLNWDGDVNGGGALQLFDYQNNLTNQSSRLAPGLVADSQTGVGYDIDWLAPPPRAAWFNEERHNQGTIPLRETDAIRVHYGPKAAVSGSSPITNYLVTINLKTKGRSTPVSYTQLFFKDEAQLEKVLAEGTSLRFGGDGRSFPEAFPKDGVDPIIKVKNIYETGSTPVASYEKAVPFALFSLSAKTTRESFTRARPVADTGITMMSSVIDFHSVASQGRSPYEFILSPLRSGAVSFENEGELAYFFGGHGSTNGSTRAVFYEVPLAPLQSIAQLRHANAASLGTAPFFTYSVGESRSHPALPFDSAKFSSGGRILFDHSWLANDALWDRYWFSTLSTLEGPGFSGRGKSREDLTRGFFRGRAPLPNPRNHPLRIADSAATEILEDTTGRKPAARILTHGGFNVNSTSVPAWTAVLSSLTGSEVPLHSGSEDAGSSTPFPRVRRPFSSSQGVGSEAFWSGFRTLDESQVKSLAEQIVVEVKDRGPFLSMADFVNRRLESSDPRAIKGALQAAIDRSGINSPAEAISLPLAPSDAGSHGWQSPAAIEGTSAAGSPAEVSQGDLLSALGSFLYVRSDTFRIRAYGEAHDPSGKVIARAWCEAVLQRVPEYVDPSDTAEMHPDESVPANQRFGRRFAQVSFRWLAPEEI